MAEETEDAGEAITPLVVVDMGRRKPNQVKKLRKGKGKLLDKVGETVADLVAEGVLDADVQTVIVVVERRPELPWRM